MRKIYLHGGLGKRFGKKWELEVNSPAEAVRALFANEPEIEKYIIQKEKDNIVYGIRKSNSEAITDPEDFKLKTKKDIHIFPLAQGSGGFIMTLVTTAITTAASTFVKNKIAEAMERDDSIVKLQTKSFIFNGAQNRAEQGATIPLGYGKMKVGSNVISSSIINYDYDAQNNQIFSFRDGLYSLVPPYSRYYDARVGPLGSCFFFNLADGDNTYKLTDPAYQYIQQISQTINQGSNDGAYGGVPETIEQTKEKRILGGILGSLEYKFNFGKGIDLSLIENFTANGNWWPSENLSNNPFPLAISDENKLRTSFVCIQSVPKKENDLSSLVFYPISFTEEKLGDNHRYGTTDSYQQNEKSVVPIPVGERWKSGNKTNGAGWFKFESVGVFKALDLISEGPIDGFASKKGERKDFQKGVVTPTEPVARFTPDDYLQGVMLNEIPVKEINEETNLDSYNINEFDIDVAVNEENEIGSEDQGLLQNQYLFTSFTKEINAKLYGPRVLSDENLSSVYGADEFNPAVGSPANKQFKQGDQLYVLNQNLEKEYDRLIDYSETKYINNNWEDLEIVFANSSHYVPIPENFEEYQDFIDPNFQDVNNNNEYSFEAGDKVKARASDGFMSYFTLGSSAEKLKGVYDEDFDYQNLSVGDVFVENNVVHFVVDPAGYTSGAFLGDFAQSIPWSDPRTNSNFNSDFYYFFKNISNAPNQQGRNYSFDIDDGQGGTQSVSIDLSQYDNMIDGEKVQLDDFDGNGLWYKVKYTQEGNDLIAYVEDGGQQRDLDIFLKVGTGGVIQEVNSEEENYVSHTIINPLVDQAFVTLQIDELMYLYEGDEVEVTYKVGAVLGAIIGAVSGYGIAGSLQAFDTPSAVKFGIATVAVLAILGGVIGNNSEFSMGTKVENSGEFWPNKAKFRIKYGNEGETMYSTDIIMHGVATSPYRKDVRIYLPENPNQRDRVIKVYKINRERNPVIEGEQAARYKETLTLSSITEITPLKLNYTNSVIIGTRVNARDVPSIPTRTYHLRLKKVRVPNNYSPETREYSGNWNGQFSEDLQWTDNPAWCILDLITNKRFGIGKFGLKEENVDRWTLYKIAKYCDQLVPTGYSPKYKKIKPSSVSGSKISFDGVISDENEFNLQFNHEDRKLAIFYDDGEYDLVKITKVIKEEKSIEVNKTLSSGEFKCAVEIEYPLLEPRYTLNAYIMNQQNAFKFINQFTEVFRAYSYWAGGSVNFFQDEKKEAIMMFSNNNISEEGFSYSSTPKTSRTNSCNVRYVDRYNMYRPKLERAEDREAVQENNMIEQTIDGFGITSQAQAKRAAEFLVKSANMETEILSFNTSMVGSYLRPGDIIDVLDNKRTVGRFAGHIVDIQVDERGMMGEVTVDYPVHTIVDPFNKLTWKNIEIYQPEKNETIRSLDSAVEVTDEDIDNMRFKQFGTYQVFDIDEDGKKLKLYNDLFTFVPGNFTWYEAIVDARKRGGRVAQITDENSQLLVEVNLPNDQTAWLGGYNRETPSPERLVWENSPDCNDGIQYFNWAEGYPKFSTALETDNPEENFIVDDPFSDSFLAGDHPEGLSGHRFITINGSTNEEEHGKWKHEKMNERYGYVFEKISDDSLEKIVDSQGTTFILNDSVNFAKPKQYRVINITEKSNGIFSIQALEYDQDKFDNIEKDISIKNPEHPVVFTSDSIYRNT